MAEKPAEKTSDDAQVPQYGPLSIINEETDWTGVSERLHYNGSSHLRKCFRIPLACLHFNIENGRYHTKFLLLQDANKGVIIDPREKYWREEILKLLNGTWKDPKTGVSTEGDREHFEQLVQDIQDRGQDRPGLVLATGGVMGGNRRLAALITLAKRKNDPRFQRFEAFVVPGDMDMTDRWRLEITAQMGQGRLLREYDSVERLLKIQQGVALLLKQNPSGGRAAAVHGVATDFGIPVKAVEKDLASLESIEDWLVATGRPKQWWHADGRTEVFTEVPSVLVAAKKSGVSLQDLSSIKRNIYNIISNNAANYQLMRKMRVAFGGTGKTGSVSTAVKILITNAPTAEALKTSTTNASNQAAEEQADLFLAELDAHKEERTPLVKAQTAETNLTSVLEILQKGGSIANDKLPVLRASLRNSRKTADTALAILVEGK